MASAHSAVSYRGRLWRERGYSQPIGLGKRTLQRTHLGAVLCLPPPQPMLSTSASTLTTYILPFPLLHCDTTTT